MQSEAIRGSRRPACNEGGHQYAIRGNQRESSSCMHLGRPSACNQRQSEGVVVLHAMREAISMQSEAIRGSRRHACI